MMPSGKVIDPGREIRMKPRKKSFHIQTPFRIMTAAMAGRVSGNMIRQKHLEVTRAVHSGRILEVAGSTAKKPVSTSTPSGIPRRAVEHNQ